MSYVIISLKNMSVINFLRLQGDDVSGPYDKKTITARELRVLFNKV